MQNKRERFFFQFDRNRRVGGLNEKKVPISSKASKSKNVRETNRSNTRLTGSSCVLQKQFKKTLIIANRLTHFYAAILVRTFLVSYGDELRELSLDSPAAQSSMELYSVIVLVLWCTTFTVSHSNQCCCCCCCHTRHFFFHEEVLKTPLCTTSPAPNSS